MDLTIYAKVKCMTFVQRIREGTGDILVKFMMNENDVMLPIESSIAPFYTWTAAREFLKSQADDATAIIVRSQQ